MIQGNLMRLLATAALSVGFSGLVETLCVVNEAAAATSIECTAVTVTTRHSGFSTETVRVQTSPDARVMATAHYQHLTRVSRTAAHSNGAAILSFHDSNVKGHFRVVVDVSVTLGTATGTCTTSFSDD